MMTKISRSNTVIIFLYVVYLVVDIYDYFAFRGIGVDGILRQAFYESTEISYLKWAICIVAILSIAFYPKYSKASSIIQVVCAMTVFSIAITKGRLESVMIGSEAFNFLLLELTSIILFYKSINQLKKQGLTWIKVISLVLAAFVIATALLYPIEPYLYI
jgi:hypothetical protein